MLNDCGVIMFGHREKRKLEYALGVNRHIGMYRERGERNMLIRKDREAEKVDKQIAWLQECRPDNVCNLELSVRAMNALKVAGIKKISLLKSMTDGQILSVGGIGVKTMEEIRKEVENLKEIKSIIGNAEKWIIRERQMVEKHKKIISLLLERINEAKDLIQEQESITKQ